MEGIEMEDPILLLHLDSTTTSSHNEDLCNWILSRFGRSTNEDHLHLCAVIGDISQTLKDQNLPSTPAAYFGAACSSLDRLFAELEPINEPPVHVIQPLLIVLHLVLPRISAAIVNKEHKFLSELLFRVLRSPSLSSSIAATTYVMKCVSQLLIIGDALSWSDVSQLYGVLLGFVTDSRPKMRRQSHMCLRDALSRFRETSLLVPASEGIIKIFERPLLLAGGSKANTTEGHKGAQEVLYVLDALKECLPHMSMKCTTSILKHFKSLLELHQPVVTKRITDSLYSLCLVPAVDVSPEALLNLLNSIALSVSTNETSADAVTFAARLLDVGMIKMYSLNRPMCVTKLPAVFNALKDILASEHEEAIYAAMRAFKSLINACIDESLIKQGVDQIMTNAHNAARRSGPTIIEKVCAIIESLLGYHYTAVWDVAFQVVSTMFDKLGEGRWVEPVTRELGMVLQSCWLVWHYSSYFLRGILSSLADMQKLPDEDFPFRKQLHECLGSAIVALGPETFLGLVPLNLEAESLSEASDWLFPILKQYIVGARLSFFTESILGMVGLMKQKSRKDGFLHQGGPNGLVYSLWSLLPSFCNYPLDTAESFKDLEKALCSALHEEPDTRGIICSSLQILIQQNKRILGEKSEMPDLEDGTAGQRAVSRYTPQVASDNLSALRSSARELLNVLSGVFLQSTKDDGGSLQSTIDEFASISDNGEVSRVFKTTMQKLLKVTQEAGKPENSRNSNSMRIDDVSNEGSLSLLRARLFDLAVSLLPGLNTKEVDLLYVSIKLALQDVEGLIQKKAYKVLSVILKKRDGFLSSKLEELHNLMTEVLPSCHFSAKRHRLDCLYFLVVHVCKDGSEQKRRDIIISFLTEIVLALKEVAGGLAGETPHMVSAAIRGLARLAYEFSALVSTAWNLLPSTFLLLQRKNREIIKANLGLLKVLVTKSEAEWLHADLRSMVEGVLKCQDHTKSHFKAKVKLLLEILVKKCGLDAVKAVMPEEHMKLLTNIRKIKERKERKLRAESEARSQLSEARSQLSKATTSSFMKQAQCHCAGVANAMCSVPEVSVDNMSLGPRLLAPGTHIVSKLSRWNHTKIFSDFGDDETEGSDAEYMDARTMNGQRSKASSLLKSKAASLRSKRRVGKNLPEHLFDQLEELDPEGRLIIREGEEKQEETTSEPDLDAKSEADSHLSANTSRRNQKRRKTSDSGWAYTGSEYSNKKAGGDVKKKGKLEPYAYWPLDRKMMSRRPEHRAAARKGMASVVKMTKKLEGKSASSVLSSKGLKFKRNLKKGNKKKSR
uniref:Uncharacterized protein n=1 Tax=Fagus sylvatica TaxID=28930 RepID=A0A2N9GW92_FAGSY